MYSSIPEEKRGEVIERCYWPLLRIAKKLQIPIGIEASGYTLETIAAIDPNWIAEFRRLIENGVCEIIGSGYAQIIGPLVPADVNAANLRLGNQTYEDLLAQRPKIALVNEQAYSAGLIQNYLDAGYRAIIMEWDNPARVHREWPADWRYLPQIACGQHGEEIPVIWNKSIAFQKFQRYVHDELSLESYLDYLHKHHAETPRVFPLYGNDAEIFDFRPGRYHTEAELPSTSEWQRIEDLLSQLQRDGSLNFISPKQVLDFLSSPGAGQKLHLESPEQPVPVKKQGKYNLTRWAVTGRDDLGINTECWRIYQSLKNSNTATEADWRELCYLWSSDFRTHITEKRWLEYYQRLKSFASKNPHEKREHVIPSASEESHPPKSPVEGGLRGVFLTPLRSVRNDNDGHTGLLTLETEFTKLTLNPRRGLAIDGLWFTEISDEKLIGTLPHGYYDDISLGADFYSGHLVYETPGQPKIADLNRATMRLAPATPPLVPPQGGKGNDVPPQEGKSTVEIAGEIKTTLGPLQKIIRVFKDSPRVELEYLPDWRSFPLGSLRLGMLTFNPAAFDRNTLYYRTCNGGAPETFFLFGKIFDHGSPVSFLVSASHGLGMTEGWIEIGDAQRGLRIEVDRCAAALLGLISFRELTNTFFLRLAFSASEMDDTSLNGAKSEKAPRRFRIAISPISKSSTNKVVVSN
jgi:hypothetical protein